MRKSEQKRKFMEEKREEREVKVKKNMASTIEDNTVKSNSIS